MNIDGPQIIEMQCLAAKLLIQETSNNRQIVGQCCGERPRSEHRNPPNALTNLPSAVESTIRAGIGMQPMSRRYSISCRMVHA
jgi:hypothetical protein